MEKWKTIKGANDYQVSTQGRVFSKKIGRLLAGHTQNGKQYFSINGSNMSADRLVLQTFKRGDVEYPAHLDGDLSNDFLPNLESMSYGDLRRYYNTLNGKIRGVYHAKHGKKNFRAVLKVDNKVKTVGYFKTYNEASTAYMNAYQVAYGYYPLGV